MKIYGAYDDTAADHDVEPILDVESDDTSYRRREVMGDNALAITLTA